MEHFLDNLPKLPSHYCRKSSKKVYLEPITGNGSNMAENPEGALEPLSRFTFAKVVAEKNLAFPPPKKDQCDLCISFEAGHISQEDYNQHIYKK